MFPPEAEATKWLILFRRDALMFIIRNRHITRLISSVMQVNILFVYASLSTKSRIADCLILANKGLL